MKLKNTANLLYIETYEDLIFNNNFEVVENYNFIKNNIGNDLFFHGIDENKKIVSKYEKDKRYYIDDFLFEEEEEKEEEEKEEQKEKTINIKTKDLIIGSILLIFSLIISFLLLNIDIQTQGFNKTQLENKTQEFQKNISLIESELKKQKEYRNIIKELNEKVEKSIEKVREIETKNKKIRTDMISLSQ